MDEPTPSPLVTDPTELDRLRVVLLRLSRRIRSNSPEDVTASQLSALGTVFRCQPVSISQIAAREHVKPPTISKIISVLEQRGLVARTTEPGDRRTHLIVLTDAGLAMVEEIQRAERSWLYRRLEQLNPTDVNHIESALASLERLLGQPNNPSAEVPAANPDDKTGTRTLASINKRTGGDNTYSRTGQTGDNAGDQQDLVAP